MKTFNIALALAIGATSVKAVPSPKPQEQEEVASFTTDQTFDNDALAAAAAQREAESMEEIPQFAEPVEVDITPDSDGTWETLEDGTRVWRLRVESTGALNLNFGFANFRLPEGAELSITSEEDEEPFRPFTSEDNADHGQLWTPVLDGDSALLELRLPEGAEDAELRLTQIGHGFRPFGVDPDSLLSGSCNVDVVCDQGDGWRDQIRSVGAYTLQGRNQCSGALVNTTANDKRPLFLTAFHCRVRENTAASVVVYWNYENSRCRRPGSSESGRPGDGRRNQFTNGVRVLAGARESDFTLTELSSPPPAEYNVYYSGWDARSGDFSSVVAIHHPAVEEKRISFENDSTTTTNYSSTTVDPNGTHIRVADWDLGTTEGGSSGSPLYSPQKRIVGQLHGGRAGCGNDLDDWYGRISVSWDLGLKQHLDPGNTGDLFVDGLDS